MPSIAPPLPAFRTFNLKPSWHNRAGRVDRSACLELRASEVRRKADLKPRRTTASLEAVGEVTVSARFLFNLHRKRLPQQLAGDYRTTKSNAMKPPPPRKRPSHTRAEGEASIPPQWQGGCTGVGRDQGIQRPAACRSHPHPHPLNPRPSSPKSPSLQACRHPLADNPNRGATRTKRLGLYASGDAPGIEEDWKQTVRVERHRLHERLAQHFLICPICGNKYVKLFMVMCTSAEVEDAEDAEAWLKIMEGRYQAARRTVPAELMKIRAQLLERYGLIFRGRRLVCRKCLKIRYGERRKP